MIPKIWNGSPGLGDAPLTTVSGEYWLSISLVLSKDEMNKWKLQDQVISWVADEAVARACVYGSYRNLAAHLNSSLKQAAAIRIHNTQVMFCTIQTQIC